MFCFLLTAEFQQAPRSPWVPEVALPQCPRLKREAGLSQKRRRHEAVLSCRTVGPRLLGCCARALCAAAATPLLTLMNGECAPPCHAHACHGQQPDGKAGGGADVNDGGADGKAADGNAGDGDGSYGPPHSNVWEYELPCHAHGCYGLQPDPKADRDDGNAGDDRDDGYVSYGHPPHINGWEYVQSWRPVMHLTVVPMLGNVQCVPPAWPC